MVKQYRYIGKYRVVEISFKKKKERYENLPESVEWWSDLKFRAAKKGIKISFRAEDVYPIRRVYTAIVVYPDNHAEQYFLTTSKKNQFLQNNKI